MAMQPVTLESGFRDGARRVSTRWLRRPAIALGVAALALAVAGDRSRAATVPAGISGQDPLEVLELKVRPNVIVVLDSSGSMTGTVGREETASGDHPRSRFYQAKQAVKSVVQNNQDKVSFQFGTYTEFGVTFRNQATTPTGRRFQYWTTDQLSPSMTTTELTVQGASDDTTLGRGLQSWQIIYDQWKTLYFEESNGAICAATPNVAFPKFYAEGASLAADLEAAMNAASCAKGNSYTVSYNGGTGRFTFTAAGPNQFRLLPASTPNNIQGALGGLSTAWGTTSNSLTPYRLLYRTTAASSGFGSFKWDEAIGAVTVTNYQLQAQRLWNGEVIRVQSDGKVCGMDFAAAKTKPPSLTLQLVAAGCGAAEADRVTFSYAGASYSNSTDECRGFRSKSSLVPCDLQSPPAPLQIDMLAPYLDNELPIADSGEPADWTTNGAPVGSAGDSVPDGVPDYVETQDGTWSVQYVWMGPSAKTTANTPIANSLIDLKGAPDGSNSCLTNPLPLPGKYDSMAVPSTIGACVERGFTKLWNSGQSGSVVMAGPAPWQLTPISEHGTCSDGTTTCPPNERKPKEKTIVLFVTDGDDTCFTRTGNTGGGGDINAMRAAYWAARLYEPIDKDDPASSVQTYVIGYGNGASPRRLNWIAWGGSGLGQGTVGDPLFVANDGNRWTETTSSITLKRARCSSCSDAFIAPDAATLASQLQGIIDQGASDGDFNAQQSITETVFEYVHLASTTTTIYDAATPSTRFNAIVPTRFIGSFSLPGFKGQQKAFQNDGAGNSVQKWSAGDVLFNQVASAMSSCLANSGTGAEDGECVFAELHAGATDATIAGSAAKIKRRIYTTTRNGVFPYTIDTLMDGTSTSRVALWPPTAPGLMHTGIGDDAGKVYDAALGLPPDTPSGFPPNPVDGFCDAADIARVPKKPFDQCWFEWMQKRLGACTGNALSTSACSGGSYATKMRAARREAREIAIAFMAGAAAVPADPTGIKRTNAGALLFKARPWILGDSELATAAVVTPPLPALPLPYRDEYKLFRDGPRATGVNKDSAGLQIKMGFGLRNPDLDSSVGTGAPDTARPNLKPVMTVLYAPANDMLHAFRAAPCDTPAFGAPLATCPAAGSTTGREAGGEELWGFIPYDQLHTVLLRPAHEPQGKNNHVFMLARGVRFADVFVPGAYERTAGGALLKSTLGAWRRILFFGRGIGGKYVTALDVTAPGPFTSKALDTTPPVPLWSRGNPDTQSGLVGGTANGTAEETTAYSKMGETWSIPTVAYVNPDKANAIYRTPRRPDGIDYALFLGSGYGGLGEGTTFYTLDALSGDVIASVDVGSRSGFTAYPNALVANAVGFNPKVFSLLTTVHPAASAVTRVYIGDVHGRLWKFLTARPDVALPVADLGSDQPVGAAVSLLGMPPQPDAPIPHIYVASGADKRAVGPFQMFGFIDRGSDTDPSIGAGSTNGTVTTFFPAEQLHARFFDQGPIPGECGYTTEAVFRATVQPATAFECDSVAGGSCANAVGRVFFAGTRLSLPNTRFAPLTPLACGTGVYPCRSQFDSTIYALGAVTGQAAYELNPAGSDQAYRIFRDSRIAAITMQADPDPRRGGSSFTPDEGLMKGAPKPPPPPGVPPTSTTATSNVRMVREPGQPAPAIRFGTTVCQK